MYPAYTYWMWCKGDTDTSLDVDLDWRKSYLITGYLTLTDGDDYGHIYLSTVCNYGGGDVELCGVRDFEGDFDLSVNEVVGSASRVTIKLRNDGGSHRAEGVIYEL